MPPKNALSFDPLIVHVANLAQAESLAHWHDQARQLAAACWPGPLTIVLPRRMAEGEVRSDQSPAGVADLVTSGLDTVGLRCPDHDMAKAVIAASGPVAAPSANLFGRISPTTAQHVLDQLAEKVALVLDGGPCRVGVESTVLTFLPSEQKPGCEQKPKQGTAKALSNHPETRWLYR